MDNKIVFQDYSSEVKAAIDNAAITWLHESAGELKSQTQRNTRVDTGQLKGSWEYRVDEAKQEAVIGSPLENAIWEEFGTGEHALGGKGRKKGWVYKDVEGKWHFTIGKKPSRAFFNAYEKTKPKIIKRAQEIFKTELK